MIRIAVASDVTRCRLGLTSDALSVRVLEQHPDGARVALVAPSALLLAGDEVRIDVDLAAGSWLDVVEATGTVVYGGARPSGWRAVLRLGDGAALRWDAWPYVVSDGARTTRSISVELGRDARALLREILVLGRTGQRGGDVRTSLHVRDPLGDLQVETLDLTRAARAAPGVLGPHRVMDTVTALGWDPVAVPAPGPHEGAMRLDRGGAVFRWVGDDLHDDTAGTAWFEQWARDLGRPGSEETRQPP